MAKRLRVLALLPALLAAIGAFAASARTPAEAYEHEDTRALVALVTEAARLVAASGEAAFAELRVPGSRWREGETYIFVLDTRGHMRVHPDPGLEGTSALDLQDVDGRPIIRGLITAATAVPGRPDGWYHYRWPVPGGLLPRWKSSYVRLVRDPSGQEYVVGAGDYNDRMERAFAVDMVEAAIAEIEQKGEAAFPRLRDRQGPFFAKDAYVFVFGPGGVERVNPAFPNLEGRNLLELRDSGGKPLVREMLEVVRSSGSGWVDYLWPKPGENVSTRKSAYVSKAKLGDGWVLVGCGVYLADAPKEARPADAMTAAELTALVREAGALLEESGEKAHAELRTKGSKWFHDDVYFFVWTLDGTRVFHAADPSLEGTDARGAKDALGRPYGEMILETAASPSGEGWVHYMYPEAGDIFPTWKSTFVKRVTYPSGAQHVVGCGIYEMRLDEAFIEDVVDRAAHLVATRGQASFGRLRERTGPFFFMDTYVFVDTPDGVERVNPAQPSLEGRNLMDLTDVNGKHVAREYIAAAMEQGSAWVTYHWYKPGDNTPAPKRTYVRKVQSGRDTYIVGAGFYPE